MKRLFFILSIYFSILNPSFSLIEVDITRGNLDPLPIAVSPLHVDIKSEKISDVEVDGTYCIESIVLKVPERREVQTKSGESIALSEMFVEDDTGQIWVKGWRIQAKLIDKCELGEIIAITGLNAKTNNFGEGRIELFLTAHSKIIKKN